MASNIHKPNLKINEMLLSRIKLSSKIKAIILKLMTDIPNINRINADNNSAVNSNIMLLKVKMQRHNTGALHYCDTII
jgi:hypothetical protein